MSLFTRLAVPARNAPRLLPLASHRALLHTTSVRAALSESDLNREDRQNEVEHHKHDNLRKQKEGKAHWKPELGSNSEAAIKADRGEADNTSDDIASLQKETEQKAKKDHKGE